MLYKSDILYNEATIGGGASVEEAESTLVFHGGIIVEMRLLGLRWIKAEVGSILHWRNMPFYQFVN